MEQQDAEKTAVERLLAYVNLGKVTDAAAVYKLLFEANVPTLAVQDSTNPDVFHALTPGQLVDSPKAAAAILETDRAEAQVMLEALAKSNAAARKQHAETISELVAKGVLAAFPTFDGRQLRLRLQLHTSGVEASSGYGLALLYDSTRPYGAALRHCALPSCNNWFLNFARGAGGPRPRYCTPEHQAAADKLRAPKRARTWRRNNENGEKRVTRIKRK